MSREKEDFRAHLEILQEVFPGESMITLNRACKYLHKDPRTLKKDKTFPIKRCGKTGYQLVPVVGLARWMAS